MEENKKKVFWFTIVLGLMMGFMVWASTGSASTVGFLITGAGRPEVNGLYCPFEMTDGVPNYLSTTNTMYLYREESDHIWHIFTTAPEPNAYYYNTATPNDVPPLGTYAISQGPGPSPTVSLVIDTCPGVPGEAAGVADKANIYFYGIFIFCLGYWLMRKA